MTGGRRELGLVGLGRIGGGLAHHALERGMRVVGFDRQGPPRALLDAGLVAATSLAELARALAPPRIVMLYVPAGPVVDTVLGELGEVLAAGDVVIDGGNSYWGDSIRRAAAAAGRGIELVDLGTSGGIEGARRGACFMAGGADHAVARVRPLLEELAVPGGFVHAGPSGAGHFAKLVHNGIEFGMLQAIGEGVALLEAFGDALPVADILRCWRSGSVIRSWLIDLLEEQYRARGGLDEVPAHVEDTGEVNWLVEDALHMEIPVPIIAGAVMQLLQSRDGHGDAGRAVALMRLGFGGHRLGADPQVAAGRSGGRVGPFVARGRRRPG